jgi:hypothetical protein
MSRTIRAKGKGKGGGSIWVKHFIHVLENRKVNSIEIIFFN